MSYTVSAPARSIKSVVAHIFSSIGRFLVDLGEAHPRMRRVQQLQAMSDAELAKRGLQRDEIVRYVFQDMFYD